MPMIEFDIEEEDLERLKKIAEEYNITFDDLMTNILNEHLERLAEEE